MKKVLALLVLATIVFTGCTKDKVTNLEEQIIGKWMKADVNGQPAPTDEKIVFTFFSATKAYRSGSPNYQTASGLWNDYTEQSVVIDGNKITLTETNDHVTDVVEMTITSINANEFTAKFIITKTVNGNVVLNFEETDRFVKINEDYKQTVLGTWEGHVTSEQSEYDDYLEHRWQYNADGTYVYYNKSGNDWIPNPLNTLNEYFVDGDFLCMRWINNGAEYREWWEIASIEDNVMSWTALRKKADGTTYTASFSMTKVND
jgi:hypothetical protein